MNQTTVTEIIAEKKLPAIAIDGQGLIIFVNNAFEIAYGWSMAELKGQIITIIMPPQMRDAHNFGFSRFLVAEEQRILDRPLNLPILCKDGTIVEAEHYITGEKKGGSWQFAATITPKSRTE